MAGSKPIELDPGSPNVFTPRITVVVNTFHSPSKGEGSYGDATPWTIEHDAELVWFALFDLLHLIQHTTKKVIL